MHVVVMGVSGSGKTTVAALLAERLGHAFADGDDFHPHTNIAKMARGEPLTDADRTPWLRALGQWIAEHEGAGRPTVLACSALKRSYRDLLRAAAPRNVFVVHLAAAKSVLLKRLEHRPGHFMPPELLTSQLATLEPLDSDERGMTLDADSPPAVLVEHIVERLGR